MQRKLKYLAIAVVIIAILTPLKAAAWMPCMPFCYCDVAGLTKGHIDLTKAEAENMAEAAKSIPHRVKAISNTAQGAGNIVKRIGEGTAKLINLRLVEEGFKNNDALDAVGKSIKAEMVKLQEQNKAFSQSFLKEFKTMATSFVSGLETVVADETYGAMGLPLESDAMLFYGLQEQNTESIVADRVETFSSDFFDRISEITTISGSNQDAANEIMMQMTAPGVDASISDVFRSKSKRKSFEVNEIGKSSEQLDVVLLDYNLKLEDGLNAPHQSNPATAAWHTSEMVLRNQMARKIRDISFNEAAYMNCKEVISGIRDHDVDHESLISSRELDFGMLNKNQSPCWFRNVKMLNMTGIVHQMVLNQAMQNYSLFQEYMDMRIQNILLANWASKEVKRIQ